MREPLCENRRKCDCESRFQASASPGVVSDAKLEEAHLGPATICTVFSIMMFVARGVEVLVR